MNLGDRMKAYEGAWATTLPPRMPVIVRLDGRAFHRYAKRFERPYSDALRGAMVSTARWICERMSGAKFAYTQSDEISVLLTNSDSLDTQPWFGNDLMKIVSISASLATSAFTRLMGGDGEPHFDARAFVLPREEVANYFIWRQKDAERNSLAMLAQAHYSQRELQGKTREQQHEMLHAKGVNWNDVLTRHKRGLCVKKEAGFFVVDEDIPIFTEDRRYIEECLP